MADDSGPAPDQLEAWVEQVDVAIVQLQARLEPLLAEQARLQERRVLLKELIASFGDDMAGRERTGRASGVEGTRERVHRQAVEILTEAGRPLHSNDLHAEFQRRGFEVPGAGRPNNITVHLMSWPDVVSPERGLYGLTEHVGEQIGKSTIKRRARKAR